MLFFKRSRSLSKKITPCKQRSTWRAVTRPEGIKVATSGSELRESRSYEEKEQQRRGLRVDASRNFRWLRAIHSMKEPTAPVFGLMRGRWPIPSRRFTHASSSLAAHLRPSR